MTKLVHLFAYLCVASMTFFASAQAGDNWGTDFKQAQNIAAKQGKVMLLDFTGSDWCGWCIQLKKEVFSQQAFIEYAQEHLVLMQVDFPRKKAQSQKVKEQNRALAEKYGIRGYPTIVLLSPAGEFMQQTGYQSGGAEAYVEHLQALIAQHH